VTKRIHVHFEAPQPVKRPPQRLSCAEIGCGGCIGAILLLTAALGGGIVTVLHGFSLIG
jgi:hypothetical protein